MARLRQARAGQFGGGKRRYGFERHRVAIREDEAAEIRRAADAILAGISVRQVTSSLRDRHVPTANGAAWDSQTLRDVLMRPRNRCPPDHPSAWCGRGLQDAPGAGPTTGPLEGPTMRTIHPSMRPGGIIDHRKSGAPIRLIAGGAPEGEATATEAARTAQAPAMAASGRNLRRQWRWHRWPGRRRRGDNASKIWNGAWPQLASGVPTRLGHQP